MLKNQKGITLIALVITIIVLLILAGVSIAMLTGQNGILNQADKASEETTAAEAVERINMALSAAYAAAVAPDPVAPTVDNVKAQDATFGVTGSGYTVAADATKVTISFSKDGVTKSGSILIASPYTIEVAE